MCTINGGLDETYVVFSFTSKSYESKGNEITVSQPGTIALKLLILADFHFRAKKS